MARPVGLNSSLAVTIIGGWLIIFFPLLVDGIPLMAVALAALLTMLACWLLVQVLGARRKS